MMGYLRRYQYSAMCRLVIKLRRWTLSGIISRNADESQVTQAVVSYDSYGMMTQTQRETFHGGLEVCSKEKRDVSVP